MDPVLTPMQLPVGGLRNPKPIGVGYIFLGLIILLIAVGCMVFLVTEGLAELTTFQLVAVIEASLIGVVSIANGFYILRHKRQNRVLRSIGLFIGVLFIGTMIAENRQNSGS